MSSIPDFSFPDAPQIPIHRDVPSAASTPAMSAVPPTKSQREENPRKPCRVCSDFKQYTKKNTSSKETHIEAVPLTASTIEHGKIAIDGHSGTTINNLKEENNSSAYTPFPCPPDSQELGRSTWTFLHTMAAYYPETPDQKTQRSMTSFFSDFSNFYPCGYCASHLRDYLVDHPPVVKDNTSLSFWLCGVHNEVNERLGKPQFDCTKVFERWKTGCE